MASSGEPSAPKTTCDEHVVRWGIVATGKIAQAVTEDLQMLEGARIEAVSSRSATRAQEFADQWDIPRAHAGLDALLSDDGIDVVYVATPHAQHHAVVSRLLDAGRPVLCEKSFTLNLADAEDLVARARRRDVFCMEAMWTRFNPVVVRLRELVAGGAVGEVRSLTADLGFAAPWDPTHRLWDAALGGGALLDVGVYPVSFASMLLGEPSSVAVHGSLDRNGVDRDAGLLLGYPGGAHALLSCSLVARLGRTATVTGTEGHLALDPPFHATTGLTWTRPNGSTERFEQPLEGNGYVPMLREVQRCLRAGEAESPTMPLDETLAVMRVLDGALAELGVRYPEPAPIDTL